MLFYTKIFFEMILFRNFAELIVGEKTEETFALEDAVLKRNSFAERFTHHDPI